MTPKKAVSIGACVLIITGVLFYLSLFIMHMLDMTVEYTGGLYAGIGFWLGAAFTLSIMYRILEVSDDKSMDN